MISGHSEDVTIEKQQTLFQNVEVFDTVTSDPIGHHPGVQFQKERLQLAQPALLLLPFLLTVPTFLVHSVILALLVLLLVHPGHPGAAVPAGVGSRVVGRKINRHGCLVVVGEAGQQLLDHVWPLACQVPPLARVGCDVEQPDVFVGGGFVEGREDTFQVPPGTGQGGKYLRIKTCRYSYCS